MIDYNKEFRQLLLDAVPPKVGVYYEAFAQNTVVPCVSYMELGNESYMEGDTLRYSSIAYQVKVWAKNISEIQSICLSIDKVMYDNKIKRTMCYDTNDNGLLVKIMRYENIGYEVI